MWRGGDLLNLAVGGVPGYTSEQELPRPCLCRVNSLAGMLDERAEEEASSPPREVETRKGAFVAPLGVTVPLL